MFLRSHRRVKNGKEHRYYSLEESRRLQSGRVVQRRGNVGRSGQADRFFGQYGVRASVV